MGRPPLKVTSTHMRLPTGVGAKIDAIVGKNGKRADFIRKAVDAALAKEARLAKAKSKPKRATKPKAKTRAKPKASPRPARKAVKRRPAKRT